MDEPAALSKSEVWPTFDPYPQPSHPQKNTSPTDVQPIRVRHPGYPDDSCNTLLKFWSTDGHGGHHETVRVSCAIVANSAWEGYLSTDREGCIPVTVGPEGALRSVIVDYDVVPTFDHYQFPSTLPPTWKTIPSFPQRPQPPSDSCCRLTQCDYSVESAHLVPAAVKAWFDRNSMSDYTDSTVMDKMKHANNTVRLKSDIHTVFDAKRFAVVPIGGRLVAYCLNAQPGSHIERLCHGVELHRLSNPPQLLLARLAYTVFENLRDFLDAGVERRLCIRSGNTWATESCEFERCQQFSRATGSQGKSRSASPKKRSRTQDTDKLEIFDAEWSDGEERRGRKRRRTGETTTWPPSISSRGASSSCLSDDQGAATPRDSRSPIPLKMGYEDMDGFVEIPHHALASTIAPD